MFLNCNLQVKLRESALAEVGLPVKCVHGKVSRLVIKVSVDMISNQSIEQYLLKAVDELQIPWFNLYSSKTTIDIEGLHLLVVPSTSVKYDADKERREANEAKQKHLQRIEDARTFREGEDKGLDTVKKIYSFQFSHCNFYDM